MKYFLIAGEPSGDLHASNLMRALKEKDAEAQFVFYGGDKMKDVGGTCLCHYKEIAYMGFIPVLLHLRTILSAMKKCKQAIVEQHPDVLILVDYPGFNLNIAKFIKTHTGIPVYYYILPKVWAWKEKRVEKIKSFIDERFSILPFEIPFFEGKHQCPIHYIGNPSVDEITAYQVQHPSDRCQFLSSYQLEDKPIIALLPGSRIQEIKDNFVYMVEAALPYVSKGYQLLVAATPDIADEVYLTYLQRSHLPVSSVQFLRQCAFSILQNAEAAIVTSGTATLETALFRVPQVVCYNAAFGKLMRKLKPYFLKVKYISLVNLILNRELVCELIGDEANPQRIREQLDLVLEGGKNRQAVLEGYQKMITALGPAGASQHAADKIISMLENNR